MLTACGGMYKSDYDSAAKMLCDCMNESLDASERSIPELPELEYSICILEIRSDVDPRDPQMAKSIEACCPDLLILHQDFVENK